MRQHLGMDVEEEDKTVFCSLFFEIAKEHLKKQIYTHIYIYIFSFPAEEEELAHQSWKSV